MLRLSLLLVVILGSLLVISCQPKSNVISDTKHTVIVDSIKVESLDTVALAKKLFNDIDKLLEAKDSLLINQTIFGDCIYEQLDINDPDPIRRIDIIRNFNSVFDKAFKTEFYNLKNSLSIEYEYLIHDKSMLAPFPCEAVGIITVDINPGYFSRIYWFSFDGETWIFRGITGAG